MTNWWTCRSTLIWWKKKTTWWNRDFFTIQRNPNRYFMHEISTIDRCFRCAGGGDGGTSRSTSGPISSVAIALPDGIALKKIGPLTVVEHSVPVHVVGFGDHKVPLTKTRGVRTVVGGHDTQATKGVALVTSPKPCNPYCKVIHVSWNTQFFNAPFSWALMTE